jgi:S1/P1 Nuclease
MRACLAVLVVLLALIQPAMAWNDHGHMIVAAIAYERLTPEAKSTVGRLLALNPKFNDWIARETGDRTETAFILAATWPDAIKRDNAYQNDGASNGDIAPTSGAGAAAAKQNIGYVDHLRHKYWHFVDQPFSPDGTALIPPVPPNAETQIKAFEKAMQSKSTSDDVKSYDLVWLEHIIGDVHQPLHAVSRFTRDLPKGDAGGNRVSLCPADKPKCRDELHAFWDDVLGSGKSVTSAKSAATRIADGRVSPTSNTDVDAWLRESFEIAQSDVYVQPVGVGKGPFTLDSAYKKHARVVAEERVWLAGNRLADFLNEALGTAR